MNDMEKELEQLVSDARLIVLHPEERMIIRRFLASFIHAHPTVLRTHPALWSWHRPVFAALSFLFIASGIFYSAEQANPGDFLYPVKVDVGENIRGIFAISEESQMLWQITQAERRMQETEILASEAGL